MLESGDIVAGTSQVHRAMLELLAEAAPREPTGDAAG
jgi:hypothetical protein